MKFINYGDQKNLKELDLLVQEADHQRKRTKSVILCYKSKENKRKEANLIFKNKKILNLKLKL